MKLYPTVQQGMEDRPFYHQKGAMQNGLTYNLFQFILLIFVRILFIEKYIFLALAYAKHTVFLWKKLSCFTCNSNEQHWLYGY